jgi:diacylglycerol O-acyltransferase
VARAQDGRHGGGVTDTTTHRNGGRLSVLDGSFLRMESGEAHMHMGFNAVFAAPADHPRPSVEALRERAARHLHEVPWCRWCLDDAPLGLSEPRWLAATEFDLHAHIVELTSPEDRVSDERFEALRAAVLSAPLDRARPLWQISLVPRLADGRVGMIGKVHHALVDGMGALQFAKLIFDDAPSPEPADAPPAPARPWRPTGRAGRLGWALDSISRSLDDGVGALRDATSALTHPEAAATRVVRRAKLLAGAVREDVLPHAPQSGLNATIGARRTLVGYRAGRDELRAARAGGGTMNDIGLTVVAGALRSLALRRGESPAAPLKASIPVSTRRLDDTAAGNRIAMVAITLPIHLDSPPERREYLREQMRLLKHTDRTAAVEALYDAAGLLPPPLRSPVARALSAPRQFNLTISNPPAPRGSLYLLGCELEVVYTAVPIAQGHALAIGMVRYRQELFVGCYADPDALSDVHDLPALLATELHALGQAAAPPDLAARRASRTKSAARPVGVTALAGL